jgi:hypothetical protein
VRLVLNKLTYPERRYLKGGIEPVKAGAEKNAGQSRVSLQLVAVRPFVPFCLEWLTDCSRLISNEDVPFGRYALSNYLEMQDAYQMRPDDVVWN